MVYVAHSDYYDFDFCIDNCAVRVKETTRTKLDNGLSFCPLLCLIIIQVIISYG